MRTFKTRISFKKKLNNLTETLEDISEVTLNNYKKAIQLYEKKDPELNREVKENVLLVNKEGVELEKICIEVIATEQPFALDLRFIESCIKLSSYLKRINHISSKVADSFMETDFDEIPEDLTKQIKKMADLTGQMLVKSINAFMDQDVELAKELRADDKEVDILFDNMLEEFKDVIFDNKEAINSLMNIIFIARYLERIADKAVSIADRLMFMLHYKNPKKE